MSGCWSGRGVGKVVTGSAHAPAPPRPPGSRWRVGGTPIRFAATTPHSSDSVPQTPCSGRLSADTRDHGNRPPSRPDAGCTALSTGVSLQVIDALVLAAARRLLRPAEALPLKMVRSLAYFLPVIEEVRELEQFLQNSR